MYPCFRPHVLNLLFFLYLLPAVLCGDDQVEPATACETCALLARELTSAAKRVHEKSESNFIDLSEHLCESMMSYKLHKEKTGIGRFARDESGTMKMLKKLRDRGVEVNLGMPYEMWDEPAAEVTLLRRDCDVLLARFEDELTEWFVSRNPETLENFLCRSRALHGKDSLCLPSGRDDL